MLLRQICLMLVLSLAELWTGALAESQSAPHSRTLILTDYVSVEVFYMTWNTFLNPCDEVILSCTVWNVLVPYFKHGPESGILVLQRLRRTPIHVKPVRSGLYVLEQPAGKGKDVIPSTPSPFRKLAEMAYGERFGLLFSRLTKPWKIFPLSEKHCRLPSFQTECLRLEIRLPTWETIQERLLDHIDGVIIPRLLKKHGRGYLISADIDQELEIYNQAIRRSVEQSLLPVGILRYVEGKAHLMMPGINRR